MIVLLTLFLAAFPTVLAGPAEARFTNENTAVENTAGGELTITPLQHAGVLFQYPGATLVVDPFGVQKMPGLPKADVILLTHQHPDHVDPASLKAFAQPATVFVVATSCRRSVGPEVPRAEIRVLENGQSTTVNGVVIQAIPAYNTVGRDPTGTPFHEKGAGNGYLLNFSETRVYLAGDTDKIKEMESLGKVDIAFLPILKPYCLDEAACLQALKTIKPRVFYPYHYLNLFNGNRSDLKRVVEGAAKLGIEVRALKIY